MENRSWLAVVTVVLALLTSNNAFSTQGRGDESIQKCAGKYPPNTAVLIYTSDFSAWIREFAQTSLGRALLDTPQLRVLDFGARALQDDSNSEIPKNSFEQEENLSGLASRLLSGSFQFAVLEIDNELHWLMSLGYDTDIEIVQFLKQEIKQKRRYGILEFENFNSDTETTEIDDDEIVGAFLFQKPKDVYFQNPVHNKLNVRITQDLIEFASSPKVFKTVKEPVFGSNRSLRENRRFREVLHHCGVGELKNELVCYVNLTEMLQHFLEGDSLAQARKSKILDLLTFGGRVVLNSGSAEIKADFYLGYALPRDGINNVLKISKLDRPINPGVPADTDIYLNSNLDLKELIDGIAALDTALASEFGRPKSASRGLAVIAPLLAMICQCNTDDFDIEGLTGKFDLIGKVADRGNYIGIDGVTRLETVGANDSMLPMLQRAVPGFDQLVEKTFEGTTYLTWSEQMLEQVKSFDQRSRNDGFDTSGLTIEPQAWVVYNNFLAFFEKESQMKSWLSSSSIELLRDDNDLQRVWKLVKHQGAPGLFVFAKGPEFFRPLYLWLQMRHIGGSDWAIERKKTLEKKQQRESFEYKYRVNWLETLDDWSYDEFRKSFGPGGIGVFQRDHGFIIRLIQLSPIDGNGISEKQKK